jgi:hypothetical protein
VVKTVGLLLRYFSALFLLYTFFFLIFLNFIYNKVMSQSPILMVFLTKSTIAIFFFFLKKKKKNIRIIHVLHYCIYFQVSLLTLML